MMGRRKASLHRRYAEFPPNAPRGFSLMEVMVVLTIMGVLIGLAAPSFQRALEQSRADMAGANLRAIWSAERLFWLENHAYTSDLSQLVTLGLIDPTVASAATVYVYTVASADDNSFSALATRAGSTRWIGVFAVDQTGAITGSIDAAGQTPIQPGFQ